MKEEYKIRTTTGIETRTGDPYKFYQSGDKFVYYKIPGNGRAVLTVHQQTGAEFVVYPRRENGLVYLTEKLTGLDVTRPGGRKKTMKAALDDLCSYADVVLSIVERSERI